MEKLDIINLALRHLGMNKITSAALSALADPSAIVMNDFWDTCLNSAFEEHQWSFANVQATLNPATIDVPVGWTFAYDYPTENCAAVWTVFNEGTLLDKDSQDFDSYLDIDSGTVKLVTDLDDAYCEYTYIIEDPATWPRKFSHMMSYFLAASACGLLTGDADKAMKLMAVYNAMIDEAQRMDSFKASKKAKLSSGYENARG